MFEAFPSMKTQFAEMQSHIEEILSESKPHPLAEPFDRLMQLFLQEGREGKEEVQEKCVQVIADYEFQRKQFYQLLTRSCVKFLKKDLKKIQELITLYSKPTEQSELNRIKLDKILKECFGKIQQSASNLYEFIDQIDAFKHWECHCKKDECVSRQSYEQFVIDIFGFFVRNSQLFNDEIVSASKREKVLHKVFSVSFEPRKKDGWRLGNCPGELILQVQKDCQKSKSKKRKKNKKQKRKRTQSDEIGDEQINQEQQDEREKDLCSFLESLDIDPNDRQKCIVTEECLKRIAVKNHKSKE